MQTSVKLQPPFSYPILIIIFVIILFVFLVWYRKKLKKKRAAIISNEKQIIPEKNIKNKDVIKEKYLRLLEEIENNFNSKKINTRTAYQKISETIRMFVFEMTDIKTQNYSLAEIRSANIPILYELIEEYYEPEFASKSMGDFEASIKKARRVINEWN